MLEGTELGEGYMGILPLQTFVNLKLVEVRNLFFEVGV